MIQIETREDGKLLNPVTRRYVNNTPENRLKIIKMIKATPGAETATTKTPTPPKQRKAVTFERVPTPEKEEEEEQPTPKVETPRRPPPPTPEREEHSISFFQARLFASTLTPLCFAKTTLDPRVVYLPPVLDCNVGKVNMTPESQLLSITPPQDIRKVLRKTSASLALLLLSPKSPIYSTAVHEFPVAVYSEGKRFDYQFIPILPEIVFSTFLSRLREGIAPFKPMGADREVSVAKQATLSQTTRQAAKIIQEDLEVEKIKTNIETAKKHMEISERFILQKKGTKDERDKETVKKAKAFLKQKKAELDSLEQRLSELEGKEQRIPTFQEQGSVVGEGKFVVRHGVKTFDVEEQETQAFVFEGTVGDKRVTVRQKGRHGVVVERKG